MVMHGWMLMALGRTGQETLSYLQDARIERLENHVRDGARALQETQAAMAEHTAMIFALDTELRKKVSSSEIDPAMRDLNQKLGEAREQMQAAASATKESWDKTQNEAKAAFEKLQKSATEIAKRLKNELGLDEQDEPRDRQE
jgi:DNA anti-recombination protein RmuC